jgi:hypothetical protein
MGSLWEEMANDGPEFLETFGRPITFRNQTLTAMISRAPIEQIFSDGGSQYLTGWSVRLLAPVGSTLAGDIPRQGEHMMVFGQRCTITNVTSRPPDPWIDVLVGLSSSL